MILRVLLIAVLVVGTGTLSGMVTWNRLLIGLTVYAVNPPHQPTTDYSQGFKSGFTDSIGGFYDLGSACVGAMNATQCMQGYYDGFYSQCPESQIGCSE